MSAENIKPAPYRADIGRQRFFFDSLAEAAECVIAYGYGAISVPHGKVYRTISGREQTAAVEALKVGGI